MPQGYHSAWTCRALWGTGAAVEGLSDLRGAGPLRRMAAHWPGCLPARRRAARPPSPSPGPPSSLPPTQAVGHRHATTPPLGGCLRPTIRQAGSRRRQGHRARPNVLEVGQMQAKSDSPVRHEVFLHWGFGRLGDRRAWTVKAFLPWSSTSFSSCRPSRRRCTAMRAPGRCLDNCSCSAGKVDTGMPSMASMRSPG